MAKTSPTAAYRSSNRLQATVFLLLTVMLWGTQPLVLKLVLRIYSVPLTAFVRAAAAALLFGWLAYKFKGEPALREGESRLSANKVRAWILVGGTSLGISNLFWHASLTHTTVGASATLQLCSSVVIALYGILLLSERCSPVRALGLALSLLGMFLVSWNGQDLSALVESRYFKGNMFALAAGIGWAICGIAQKATVRGRSGASVVAPMFMITAIILLFPAIFSEKLIAPFSLPMLLVMILTGILGLGLGNFFFAQSMRFIPASIGAAVLTVIPTIALLSGVIFLHEPVSFFLLLGAPLTSLGVATAFLSMSHQEEAAVSKDTAADSG